MIVGELCNFAGKRHRQLHLIRHLTYFLFHSIRIRRSHSSRMWHPIGRTCILELIPSCKDTPRRSFRGHLRYPLFNFPQRNTYIFRMVGMRTMHRESPFAVLRMSPYRTRSRLDQLSSLLMVLLILWLALQMMVSSWCFLRSPRAVRWSDSRVPKALFGSWVSRICLGAHRYFSRHHLLLCTQVCYITFCGATLTHLSTLDMGNKVCCGISRSVVWLAGLVSVLRRVLGLLSYRLRWVIIRCAVFFVIHLVLLSQNRSSNTGSCTSCSCLS